MRVLVISHNVFSRSTGMGKTLSSYFHAFAPEELAQFYIHSEIPVDPLCERYYRVTDRDILRSVVTRKSGTVFEKEDIQTNAVSSRTDHGVIAVLYRQASRRSPLVYCFRNAAWRFGCWKTDRLRNWLDEFDPQAVFLASGDYAFLYRIAREIAQERSVPLFVSCMDDYYFQNRNAGKPGGKKQQRVLMREVLPTMQKAVALFTICDRMTKDYAAAFKKPAYTLHTGATLTEPLSFPKNNRLSYIGALAPGRETSLIAIGRALKQVSVPGKPAYVDVYSGEKRPDILQNLTPENGIRFHGEISPQEAMRVMGESLFLLHTESFDPVIRKAVAYSVSTKIADSLASGTCLLAYGPPEIASMAYLNENRAAFCIFNEEELSAGLTRLLEDADLRENIIQNAVSLAKKNHGLRQNSERIRRVMEETVNTEP